MLLSYNSHIGSETMRSVKMSDVGVMTADMMRITTMAWRRKRLIHSARSIPKRARSQQTTGISKTMPKARLIISSVSVYELSVSMLSIAALTR